MRHPSADPDADYHLDRSKSSTNNIDPDISQNDTQQQEQQEQEQQEQQQQQQQQQKQKQKQKQKQQQQHQQSHQRQPQAKHGAWGHDINTIANQDICFVFQNINGLTTFTGVHEALKVQIVAIKGTVTALAETNVNWKHFKFRDNWEVLLQWGYASLHFSHSSCDEGKQYQLQRDGTSMICNYRLGAKLLDKGSDNKLDHLSWMQFQGKHGSKVLIITAYQVSQTSAQGLGMDTV